MKFEFLKDFDKRMKKVGVFAMLNYHSFYKSTLKNYGFEDFHESTNLIFAVLMYLMEQSLKEEDCTIDDIASYVEGLDRYYLHKHLSCEDSKAVADFVVNTVLCNNGEVMYFKGYNFENAGYEDINISIVNNRTIYTDSDKKVRRTTYYLTEEGYHLILGTLEIENNMRMTVQEIIFSMHLDKADYDKAVEDVKGIFNLSRIQLQAIEEGIRRIKENVLSFSPSEYKAVLDDNIDTIETQKKKFKEYKDEVIRREKEILENNINLDTLSEKDEDSLRKLGIIKGYLARAMDEHQRIVNSHFDFKEAYARALRDMTSFAAVKRININNDLCEPIMKDAAKLDALPDILHSLFFRPPKKMYNIEMCCQEQNVIKEDEEDDEVVVVLDEKELEDERRKRHEEKMNKYKAALEVLLDCILSSGGTTTLEEVFLLIGDDFAKIKTIMPTIEIFREIMIELLKVTTVDVVSISKEAKKNVKQHSPIEYFQLNSTILELMSEWNRFRDIKTIKTVRDLSGKELRIRNITGEEGKEGKILKCSNLIFSIT